MTTASGKRGKRRRFGRVRQLPSGRWQARYTGSDGREHTAPNTFANKTDADRWLVNIESDHLRGLHLDDSRSREQLKSYAARWIDHRRIRGVPLRSSTRSLYCRLLRRHIEPAFGAAPLRRISSEQIRAWYAEISRSAGPIVAAKAYRLLRAILATAVDDGVLARNPCNIRSAGVERSPERPVATLDQVQALADAVEPRFRVMILLAAFTGLRWGELVALRRHRIDLDAGVLHVIEQFVEDDSGRLHPGEPKSDAGRRTVAIPPHLLPELQLHFQLFAEAGPDGLVFVGAKGAPLRRRTFHPKWKAAAKNVGLPALHFHDLRHTGNTLAAATGASTRELMARLGHASSRAALRYQHATGDRDAAIAYALSRLATQGGGDGCFAGDGGSS